MSIWNQGAKRLLKAELAKRGMTHTDLVSLLETIGVRETKASVDSKMSRGTFSAPFLLQCLIAMGCTKLELDILENEITSKKNK